MLKPNVALLLTTSALIATSVIPAIRPDGPSAVAATSETATDSAQDGREVFESLFFLQGGDRTRALLRHAEVSSLTNDQVATILREVSRPESVAKVQRIELELVARHPDYFSRLGSVVRMGDPAEVQRALTRAYDEMLRTPTMAAAVRSLQDRTTYVPGEVGTDCGVAVVVAFGAVLAVTAVAAVNYALAANIALGFNVAAGTNVAYQSNAVKTKSKSAISAPSDRFSDGVVAAVIEQFGR